MENLQSLMLDQAIKLLTNLVNTANTEELRKTQLALKELEADIEAKQFKLSQGGK